MIIDWTKYDLNKAREISQRFGSAAVAQMAFNISSLDLVEKGNLLKTLQYKVKNKQGEVDRIQFTYEWYGRFHEVGADNIFGSGKNIKATHWRSNAIEQHLKSLEDEFGDFYAQMIIEEVTIDSAKMKM